MTFSGQSGYFGHLMLGYQLLDTLLWCSSWPCHAGVPNTGRKPTPVSLPKKLLTIIKGLADWTDVILKARGTRRVELQTVPSWRPTARGNADDITFAIAVNNLQHSIAHYKMSHWHRILMNIHSVAFIVQWHSPVSLWLSSLLQKPSCMSSAEFANFQSHELFPEAILCVSPIFAPSIIQNIYAMCRSRACNADPRFLANLRQVPIDRMINLTQVALSISPLVLLMPQWGVSESFNRDYLIEVSGVAYIVLS
jgi:hypothetical protein